MKALQLLTGFRSVILTLLLLCSVLSIACDGDRAALAIGLRVGVAAMPAAVQSLVPHTISQATANVIVADVREGKELAIECIDCFARIRDGLSKLEKRLAKAKCYAAMAKGVRVILARHNLRGHPIIDSIHVFFDSTAAALEEYCAAVQCSDAGELFAAGVKEAEDPDKRLAARLKAAHDRLQEGLQWQAK